MKATSFAIRAMACMAGAVAAISGQSLDQRPSPIAVDLPVAGNTDVVPSDAAMSDVRRIGPLGAEAINPPIPLQSSHREPILLDHVSPAFRAELVSFRHA
jgi:hypothetical protein